MSSDTELEARDIRAGYISWCRGELPVVLAGEKFDRFIADVKADAWDEGWSAGYTDAVDDEHPQATGRHEPNPHRIESGDGQ